MGEKVEGSRLKQGDGGDEIAQLHAALETVGIEIAEAEREEKRFGDSTREAVARVQTLLGLEPSGEVSPAVLALALAAQERLAGPVDPSPRPPEGRGVLTGTVTDANGLPLAGATVVARRVGLRESDELGEVRTGEDGSYRIEYEREQPVAEADDGAPGLDVQLEVVDLDGDAGFSSPIAYDVPPRLEVALPAAAAAPTEPSEFDRGVITLSRRLGKVPLTTLEENNQNQDLTFLAGDAEIDRTQVAFQTIAARLSESAELPPELFYALLRQGVPADASVRALAAGSEGIDFDGNAKRLLDAALRASPAARRQAVEVAIRQGIVPPSYAERAEEDLKRLAAVSVEAGLDDSTGMGKTPMRAVLTAAAVPAEKQHAFMELLKETTKPLGAFWDDLGQQPGFTPESAAEVRFGFDVGRFTRGHLPLVEAIVAMREGGEVGGLADLARFTADDWKRIIAGEGKGGPIGIPPNFTAASEEEAVDAYARMLERNFVRAYPTTAFAARLRADGESPFTADAAMAEFLDSNRDFDLRRTNVDRFLKDNPEALDGNREEVRAALLTGQRLIKVASRYEVAKPLLANGIGSAAQIYSMGRARFLTTYADHPEIGPTEAARVFNRAEQAYAMSLALATKWNASVREIDPLAIGNRLIPEGVPTGPIEETAPPETEPPNGEPSPGEGVEPAATISAPDLAEFPNLQTLFGSLDLCACTQCRSVLSPAAYFTDMMRFLSHRAAPAGTAKEALLKRRPDLAQIELSCANTNTELPYIDLVNELLEDAVAPPADPIAAARARQTTLTTPELNANPEHVNDAAYATLAKAVHPLLLPFDLPLLEARTYLAQLGTDRVRLIRALGKRAPLPAAAEAEQMAVEALGLSATEAEIVTGGTAATEHEPWEFWGLAENGNAVPDPVESTTLLSGSWLEVLAHARVLLDRIELDHPGLTRVLNTRFVNPGGTVKLVCNPPDSCDLGTMTVAGLDADVLQRLHRFVRLQRRLGWDPYELDAAIQLLQPAPVPAGLPQLNPTLLRQLRAVGAAAGRFGIPVPSALALFGGIDTYAPPPLPGDEAANRSLYSSLFQNVSVLTPNDASFDLDASGQQLEAAATSAKLGEHRETLVAAL